MPRGKVATVCETNLVPGDGALLSPEWLPYADRIAPGDLGAGDVLPYKEDDPLLEAGFEATGDEEVDELATYELGLGRKRVLSAEGREAAAQRWYEGENGPHRRGRREGVLRPAPPAGTSSRWRVPSGFFRRVRQRLVAFRRSRRES